MAFADHYPLEAFQQVANLSWWRRSDLDSRIAVMRRAHGDDATWTVPAEIAALLETASAADAADRALLKTAEDQFARTLRAHLGDLHAAGIARAAANLENRQVWAASEWNGWLAGEMDDGRTRWLFASLAQILSSTVVRTDDLRHLRAVETPGIHQPPSPEQVETAWTTLCSVLDHGVSDPIWRTLVIECEDQATGDRCELHFDG